MEKNNEAKDRDSSYRVKFYVEVIKGEYWPKRMRMKHLDKSLGKQPLESGINSCFRMFKCSKKYTRNAFCLRAVFVKSKEASW